LKWNPSLNYLISDMSEGQLKATLQAYQGIDHVIEKEGDKMEVLDVLAQDVGIIGLFSDWPAAVTYYANVMGLGLVEDGE
jgi:hypothetical protein